MIKLLMQILILSILLWPQTSHAEGYQRNVEFEWEEVEGAKSYEVELIHAADGKKALKTTTQSFKTKQARWAGQLAPGKYQMRLRTRDYRGVPGEWSPLSEFPVNLEKAQIKSPQANGNVQTNSNEDAKVNFEWSPVGGATDYVFELSSNDGKTKVSEVLSSNKIEKELPVAAAYTWSVKAKNQDGIESDAIQSSEFTLLGKKIEKPKIETPENEFVRVLQWKKPEHTQNFDVVVKKFNPISKKLEIFKEWKETTVESLPFDDKWPGGIYQLEVRAQAPLRAESPWSKSRFKVQTGDRSPAAEYVATVRKSVDRITGWYAIASYLITEVSYNKTSPDTFNGNGAQFNAVGGTGRLGLGWFHPNSQWGFLSILDLSGFTIKSETYTYASSELSAIYRYSIGDRSELRVQGGAFYKEFPDLAVKDVLLQTFESTKVTAAGPHLGAEYWYSLTPKLGLQLNLHTYLSAVGLNTPNGQSLNSTFSTQVGVLGSYRLTPKLTGLLGVAQREEQVSYARSSTADSNRPGDNEAKITGTYLNFFAEWSF